MRGDGHGLGYRLRITRAILNQALERDLQFRAQAWSTLGVGLLEVAVAVIPALMIFNTTTEVRGWGLGEVLMVTGFAQLLNAFLAAVIAPNQTKMSDYIREGDLDLILIRPAPAQWLAAFRWFEPAELLAAISGAAVLVVGAVRSGLDPAPAGIGLAVVWFVVGCVAISLVWMNLGYLAFWLTSSDQVRAFLDTVLTAGRYPLAFYPTAVRVLFLSLVPIGLATTVPAQALRGAVDLRGLAVALLVIVALVIITRVHWLAGLRSYGSASS